MQNSLRLNIYCVANGGFIEGEQSEPLMRLFENFCARSGLVWRGGVGIGGGVMLNVTRILFALNATVLLIKVALNYIFGAGFPSDSLRSFIINALPLLFLNSGVMFNLFRMGKIMTKVNKKSWGVRYTRILLPSFVFIVIADIFFVVISFFSGGIFRGWLSKK